MNFPPSFLKIIFLAFCFYGMSFPLGAQDGHDTKLVFSQTAKPLQAGQGYIYTIDGLVYAADVGITSFLSVGAGTMLGLNRFGNGVFYGGGLRAKLAFSVGERWYVGVTTSVLREFGEEYDSPEMNYFGAAVVTADLEEVQLTFKFGLTNDFGLAESDTKPIPIFSTGVIVPLTHKLFLVNENQAIFFSSSYWDDSRVFSSTLVARWGTRRFSFDVGVLGFYVNDGDGDFYRALPQVGVSYHFTKGKE